MNKTTLNDLRSHLFAALEGVNNLNDPGADDKDKCSIEQAEAIVDISSQIIDTYKVEVQAMAIFAKAENPNLVSRMGERSGLLELQQPNQTS